MLHDVIFNNEKSAYDDWNIVLTKVEIPLPDPKISEINIEGSDGVLDLSEVLTGDVVYENRKMKLTFAMMDDTDYYTLISEISNYLHGKKVTVRLSNDDDYYYVGRATISKWECVERKGTVVISVNCEPYKYAVIETIRSVTVNNQTKTITLINGRKRVCPTVNVSGRVDFAFDNYSYNLGDGTHRMIEFKLVEGDNTVKITGTGTVTITYRQGVL